MPVDWVLHSPHRMYLLSKFFSVTDGLSELIRNANRKFISLRRYGLWPATLLCPWDSPGKSTGQDLVTEQQQQQQQCFYSAPEETRSAKTHIPL